MRFPGIIFLRYPASAACYCPPPPHPPLISSRQLPLKSKIAAGGEACQMSPFLNSRPIMAIALVVLVLRRPRCESRRFEWRLMAPTCGRFSPRWELAASAASSCTRIRTASPHPRATIIRLRHPRNYPRAKCIPRRYFEIILELG